MGVLQGVLPAAEHAESCMRRRSGNDRKRCEVQQMQCCKYVVVDVYVRRLSCSMNVQVRKDITSSGKDVVRLLGLFHRYDVNFGCKDQMS